MGRVAAVLAALSLVACTGPETRPQRHAGAPAPERGPMKEYVSPAPDAPSVVLYGRTAARMDEVVRLVRDLGGVSAYGAFTEEELFARIATVPRLRVVLFGGGIDAASRARARAHLATHAPDVTVSEPGHGYPYSDANIAADLRARLAAAPPTGPTPPR
ncbi:MAG: hypothetical protein JNM10_08745 [Planctomycetia bacterium]|nr:hypothetical protein [Planctomycetia bacterium]